MTTDNDNYEPDAATIARFSEPIDGVPLVDGKPYLPPGTPNRQRKMDIAAAWMEYQATGDRSWLVELQILPER